MTEADPGPEPTDADTSPAPESSARPAAKQAPGKQRGTTKTAAKKAAARKATARKPAAKKPAAKKPAAKKPAAGREAIVPEVVTEELALAAPESAVEVVDQPTEPGPLDLDGEHPSRIARAKVLAAKLKERGEDEYEHLQERRADSRAIDSVFVAVEHDTEVGGGILAGAVAFRLFLFLVPFVFVLVVIFGVGTDLAGEDTRTAAKSAGAIGLLAKSFASVAGRSTWDRIVGLFVGVFALWLTARSALKVLRVASALTWRVPVSKLARPARATLLFIAVIVGAAALTQVVGWLREASLGLGIVATFLFVLVPAGLWLLFSVRAFPHPEDVGWKAMVPGSLFVGIGLQVLHLFTVFVIARQVESKSDTYGVIGVALAMLFWAYVMGRILMAGNVLNAALWYRDHPRPDPVFRDGDDG